MKWPKAYVRHLSQVFSDHSPILVNHTMEFRSGSTSIPFRLLTSFSNHPQLNNFEEAKWYCNKVFFLKVYNR